MINLSNKNILITGASSGIGKQAALQFASLGANCTIVGRNQQSLLEVLNELDRENGQIHDFLVADLAKPEEVRSIAEKSVILDGLVCNAGIVKTKPLKYFTEELIDELFNTNTKSIFLLINDCIKQKKIKNGASVSIVSSISTIKHTPANSIYSASKGALNTFTTAIAQELAKKKIRINAVLPGYIQTNILQNSAISEDQLSRHIENYPLGRFGLPEDVTNLLCFLMSDLSKWMTGNLIKIDGGFSIK